MANNGTTVPSIPPQYFTNAGAPASGYKLFTYSASTTTKVNTYTDVALATPNANPIVLDSAGRCTIFLTPGISYKFVMAPPTDTDPPTSPIWTRDNVQAIPPSGTSTDLDTTGTAGENLAAGEVCYMEDGSGGTAGRWYRADADQTYSSTRAAAIGVAVSAISTGVSGTIRLIGRITGLSGLVTGSYYYISATAGAITATPPTNARPVGQADSSTSLILSPWALGVATTTTPGYVSGNNVAQNLGGIYTFPNAIVLTSGESYVSGTAKKNEIYARCTSALTKNNNTTLADITGLAFAVGASETWEATFVFYGISPAAADWKWTLTGPAAATAVWFGVTSTNDPPTTPQAASAFATALNGGSVGQNEMVIMTIHLRNGVNAGTVQAQMAQQTATVGDSIVNVDSYVVARRRV